jgi:hypothetical protein
MPGQEIIGRVILELIELETGGTRLVPLPFPIEQGKLTATKVKIRDESDNRKVLKVIDAEGCVEDWANESNIGAIFLNALLQNLIPGSTPTSIFEVQAQSLQTCFRSKALFQYHPQVTVSGGTHKVRIGGVPP